MKSKGAAYARFRKEYSLSRMVNHSMDATSANGKERTVLNKNASNLKFELKYRETTFFMANIIATKLKRLPITILPLIESKHQEKLSFQRIPHLVARTINICEGDGSIII